ITRCTRAILHLHRVPATMRVEHFLARVQDLYGSSALARERGNAELEIERLTLAAECTADCGLHDADTCDIQVEHACELAMQVVRHLRRTPDGQLAGRIEPPDRAVRLDRRVCRALEEILLLDDDIGCCDRGVDVTELEAHVLR